MNYNNLDAFVAFCSPIVDLFMNSYIGHKHQEIYLKDIKFKFSDEHMHFLENFDFNKILTDEDADMLKEIQKFVSHKMADFILDRALLVSKLGLNDEPTKL